MMVCWSVLSVDLSVCQSVCWSVSVSLSVCLFVYLSAFLRVLSVSLPLCACCVSMCPCRVCPSVSQSVGPSDGRIGTNVNPQSPSYSDELSVRIKRLTSLPHWKQFRKTFLINRLKATTSKSDRSPYINYIKAVSSMTNILFDNLKYKDNSIAFIGHWIRPCYSPSVLLSLYDR